MKFRLIDSNKQCIGTALTFLWMTGSWWKLDNVGVSGGGYTELSKQRKEFSDGENNVKEAEWQTEAITLVSVSSLSPHTYHPRQNGSTDMINWRRSFNHLYFKKCNPCESNEHLGIVHVGDKASLMLNLWRQLWDSYYFFGWGHILWQWRKIISWMIVFCCQSCTVKEH